MVQDRTRKTDALKPFEFQEFVQHFPNAALAKAKIRRAPFVAVSMMLSRHGVFKSGERIRPSVGTLADEAGVSKPTVRKVLAYLQRTGVLVATGKHRNPGGGSPVTEYRFVRNQLVTDVMQVKDRDWGSGKQETTVEPAVASGEPLSGKRGTTEWQTGNHNRNPQEEKNPSSDKSSSPAPVVAEPPARSGAAESQVDWMDELLSEIGALPLDGLQ
ncbi:hypothetical protein [Microbacterium sp. LWH13-1.2]|uniref:hypothetical protein n=1 Tax=Microbacterium sp. LWH13-1.2 TaxID=3135260 RepID=UPI003138C5DD